MEEIAAFFFAYGVKYEDVSIKVSRGRAGGVPSRCTRQHISSATERVELSLPTHGAACVSFSMSSRRIRSDLLRRRRLVSAASGSHLVETRRVLRFGACYATPSWGGMRTPQCKKRSLAQVLTSGPQANMPSGDAVVRVRPSPGR